MRRPRYRFTADDLGRDYVVVATGVRATVHGGDDLRDGRYAVAYSDGTQALLWPTAIAARIDDGRWELADRTGTCGCGQPKRHDQQACDACLRRGEEKA
jgi:hypothetical protein